MTFYRLAWFFYLALAVSGIIWIGLSQGRLSLDLFMDRTTWWLDLLLGCTAGSALVLLWNASSKYWPTMRRLEEMLADNIGELDKAEAHSLALISGFSEELFFRGAMQLSLGCFWTTVIFTALHSGPQRSFLWWTFFALLAGTLFSALTLYRGNIFAAVVAHALINAVGLRRLILISDRRREAMTV